MDNSPTAQLEPVARSADRSWRIRIAKERHKFSAAHFLIFDDGTAERLHGHNYSVAVELDAGNVRNGVVLDFNSVKSLLDAVLVRLDERFLVPGLAPALRIRHDPDGETEIRFQRRRYIAPSEEVCVLPVVNTSAENLAEWIADALAAALRSEFPDADMRRLAVSVEETPGQVGTFALEFRRHNNDS